MPFGFCGLRFVGLDTLTYVFHSARCVNALILVIRFRRHVLRMFALYSSFGLLRLVLVWF